MNTSEKRETVPTYVPGGARECGARYYGRGSPVHGGLNVLGDRSRLGNRKDSRWYQASATLRGRPTLFFFVVVVVVAVLDSAAGST